MVVILLQGVVDCGAVVAGIADSVAIGVRLHLLTFWLPAAPTAGYRVTHITCSVAIAVKLQGVTGVRAVVAEIPNTIMIGVSTVNHTVAIIINTVADFHCTGMYGAVIVVAVGTQTCLAHTIAVAVVIDAAVIINLPNHIVR
jgi:hypothetical protein